MRMRPFRYLVACLAGLCSLGALSLPPVAAATSRSGSTVGVAHLVRASTRVKHHRVTPMEAYVFVPGVGTVVVSVKSNGHTTIEPVPAHLNESNFTVDAGALQLRSTRFEPSLSRIATPAARTRVRRTA